MPVIELTPIAHIPNAVFHFLRTPGEGAHYGIQYWFAAVNFLIQFVGIGASANVFYRLYHGDHSHMCRASLFTEPLGYDELGAAVGCIATTVGLEFLAAHLAVDCLFGAINVIVVIAAYKDQTLREFVWDNSCDFLFYLLVLPFLLVGVLVWMLAIVFGFIRIEDNETIRQVLCLIGGLGAEGLSDNRQDLHHSFHRLQVLDVVFENTAEALISIWLFYVGYDNYATLIFFSPFLVNVAYRLIYYFLKHCRDLCSSLWRPF